MKHFLTSELYGKWQNAQRGVGAEAFSSLRKESTKPRQRGPIAYSPLDSILIIFIKWHILHVFFSCGLGFLRYGIVLYMPTHIHAQTHTHNTEAYFYFMKPCTQPRTFLFTDVSSPCARTWSAMERHGSVEKTGKCRGALYLEISWGGGRQGQKIANATAKRKMMLPLKLTAFREVLLLKRWFSQGLSVCRLSQIYRRCSKMLSRRCFRCEALAEISCYCYR